MAWRGGERTAAAGNIGLVSFFLLHGRVKKGL